MNTDAQEPDPLSHEINHTMLPKERTVAVAVMLELVEAAYDGMAHGRRHTRNRGCDGPLCRKALRDWQRKRTIEQNARIGKETREYTRDLVYVLVDQQLADIQNAYDKAFSMWKSGVVREETTLAFIGKCMKTWDNLESVDMSYIPDAEVLQSAVGVAA